jgi:hypothetical protein
VVRRVLKSDIGKNTIIGLDMIEEELVRQEVGRNLEEEREVL